MILIWWPWLVFVVVLASVFGFSVAVHLAREELNFREERMNRLRELLSETQRELGAAQFRLYQQSGIFPWDEATKENGNEAEHDDFVDRSDPDWWRKV